MRTPEQRRIQYLTNKLKQLEKRLEHERQLHAEEIERIRTEEYLWREKTMRAALRMQDSQ
jgi:hypothetical protein